jgi:hypothetical protein
VTRFDVVGSQIWSTRRGVSRGGLGDDKQCVRFCSPEPRASASALSPRRALVHPGLHPYPTQASSSSSNRLENTQSSIIHWIGISGLSTLRIRRRPAEVTRQQRSPVGSRAIAMTTVAAPALASNITTLTEPTLPSATTWARARRAACSSFPRLKRARRRFTTRTERTLAPSLPPDPFPNRQPGQC